MTFGALLSVNLPAIRVGLSGADWYSAIQHEDEEGQNGDPLNGSHHLYDRDAGVRLHRYGLNNETLTK
jgi:hypothetical protein